MPRLAPVFALFLLAACSDERAPGPTGTPDGQRGGACYGNGTCNEGLTCGPARICTAEGGGADAGTADGAAGEDAGAPGADGGAQDGGARDGGTSPGDAGAVPGPEAVEGCFLEGTTVRRVKPRAAAIGADGTFHLAFAGDALYYASDDGRGWRREVVDPRGDLATLALDSAGQPAIAYFDRFERHQPLAANVQGLKVARRTSAGWQIDALDPELSRTIIDEALPGPEIAAGPNGRLYVALQVTDGTPRDSRLIRVFTFDGGAWTHEDVTPTVDNYMRGVQLQVDALGAPMLAYQDYQTTYMIRSVDGQWRERELVRTSTSYLFSFFADAAGRPAFVFGTRPLEVRRETGAGWDVQTCDHPSALGTLTATLLEDGTPAFSLFSYQGSAVAGHKAAFFTVGASCTLTEPGTAAPYAQLFEATYLLPSPKLYEVGDLAFAAGPNQRLLAYLDKDRGVVAVSTRDGQTWSEEVVSEASIRGPALALTHDADGNAVVVSVEGVSGRLELSTHGPSGWTTEPVPMGPEEDVCRVQHADFGVVDAALHETGDILVAFLRKCRRTGDELVLSRKASFGWTQAVIDGATGPVRLGLQPDGRPAVVVGEYGSQLRYYAYDGTEWVRDNVQPASRGDHSRPALAYDGVGRPLLAYTTRDDVVVYRRDAAGAWSSENLEPIWDEYRPLDADIAVDADGHIHVAYIQNTREVKDELHYAVKEGATWTFHTVEALVPSEGGRFVRGLDLELVNDEPVIVFHSDRAAGARLARWVTDHFEVEDVPSRGDSGWSPSLDVVGGVLRVAYHHWSTGDLCYAPISPP